MRRSGQSIFTRPRPIDLNAARRAGFSLDFDLPDDAEDYTPPRNRGTVLFDAAGHVEEQTRPQAKPQAKPQARPTQPVVDDRDTEDMWASLG